MSEDTFTLNVSGDAFRKLKERAAREGMTVDDYVKRAVGLLAFFQDELAADNVQVLLRNEKAGKVEVVDVMPTR